MMTDLKELTTEEKAECLKKIEEFLRKLYETTPEEWSEIVDKIIEDVKADYKKIFGVKL